MGFFAKLFGEKGPSKIEISLDEVPAFVDKSLSGKRRELDEIIAKKFSEIKHVLLQARALLAELEKKPLEGENTKLKKIVGTSREQAIAKINSLLERLQPPVLDDLEAVKDYCIESNLLLQREIEQSGKSIAYTSIYMKDSIKELGSSIKELNEHFTFLNKKIEGFSPLFMEKQIKESLHAIKEKSMAIASVEDEIKAAKEKLSSEQNKRKEIDEKIGNLSNSADYKEISSLNENKAKLMKEKQDSKTELFSLIASIDRPLKRFSQLVDSRKLQIPNALKETMQQLQQNPLQLLKKDPKGEGVKALLLELKKAIDEGKIDLKDKERDKRLAAIDELLTFNFFSNIFWKFNEIDVQLQSLERQLSEKAVVKEISALENKAKELDRSIQQTGFSLEGLKKNLEKHREELSSLRQKLEELLAAMSSASISLK